MRSHFLPGLADKTAHFVAPLFAQGIVTAREVQASVSKSVAECVFMLCGKDYRAALGYGLDKDEAAKYSRACSRISA